MRKARIRVAVNGYGVIGKRVADAVVAQDDMELVGVADLVSDWRIQVAIQKAYRFFRQPIRRTKSAGYGMISPSVYLFSLFSTLRSLFSPKFISMQSLTRYCS
jgi:hypothetical protein